MTPIDEVRRALDAIGAPYALIGAHAMAARGYLRFTVDVDLLTTDARVLDRATWSAIEREGGSVDRRRGGEDDPLGGVVHIRLAEAPDVDVILAKWEWEAGVIERAETMRVAGADIRVPRTSDLILLKLAAGGHLDLRDAAVLLAMGERHELVPAIEEHLPEVRPDIRGPWRELLASLDE
jgi:hypothetical protein